jgi:hypothetical protein
MNKEMKMGACGIACYKCPLYLKDKCKGCSIDIPEDICPLPKCAQEKGVNSCFECKEFPCDKNYKKGPIVHALLDYWKKEKE